MPKPKTQPTSKPLSVRLDDALTVQLEDASQKTKLNKSDLARLAMERGLSIVVSQLTTMPTAA